MVGIDTYIGTIYNIQLHIIKNWKSHQNRRYITIGTHRLLTYIFNTCIIIIIIFLFYQNNPKNRHYSSKKYSWNTLYAYNLYILYNQSRAWIELGWQSYAVNFPFLSENVIFQTHIYMYAHIQIYTYTHWHTHA